MNNSLLKKFFGFAILVIGIMILYSVFNIAMISKLSFGSYHAWRQADCISITSNLYDGSSALLNPRTHYAKDDLSGLAVGEFPFINFLVAQVYKVTGKSEATYRYTIFFFYIVGLIFLYLLFYEVSNHALFSSLMTLLIGSGSVLVYYSINFLPDAPALSLGIVGFYWITIAKKKRNVFLYSFGILLITLGCLMKITIGILLSSIAVVLLMEIIMHGKNTFNFKVLGLIFISFLITIRWYYHAYQLDHHHPPFIFLTETRTYWQTYFLERSIVWHDVVHKWLPQVFLPVVWAFIILGCITSIFLSKKIKIETILLTCMSLLFSVLFFIMMYRQFLLHDYLWIGLLVTPILFASIMIQALAAWYNKNIQYAFLILISVLLVLQVSQTKLILRERYFQFDQNGIFNQNLLGLKKELRNHGIKKTDLVISIPDPSPNITLVIIDQYGFTNYRDKNKDSLSIMENINKGASYLVVSNEREYENPYLKSFIKYRLFMYKDIGVFDLRAFREK